MAERDTVSEQLEELVNTEIIMEMPKAVTPESLTHIVLVGPKRTGKSKLLRGLQQLHRRAVIDLDSVLPWNIA